MWIGMCREKECSTRWANKYIAGMTNMAIVYKSGSHDYAKNMEGYLISLFSDACGNMSRGREGRPAARGPFVVYIAWRMCSCTLGGEVRDIGIRRDCSTSGSGSGSGTVMRGGGAGGGGSSGASPPPDRYQAPFDAMDDDTMLAIAMQNSIEDELVRNGETITVEDDKEPPQEEEEEEEENECQICFTQPPNTGLNPCSHNVCHECVTKIVQCPFCRMAIAGNYPRMSGGRRGR